MPESQPTRLNPCRLATIRTETRPSTASRRALNPTEPDRTRKSLSLQAKIGDSCNIQARSLLKPRPDSVLASPTAILAGNRLKVPERRRATARQQELHKCRRRHVAHSLRD